MAPTPSPTDGPVLSPYAASVLDYPKQPSLKNLTHPEYGVPAKESNKALLSLGKPHVESFNFMLEQGNVRVLT